MNTATTLCQQGQLYPFDTIVIGSGIAALSYVIEFSNMHPRARIALLSKSALNESNSYYAQGGIAASLSSADSLNLHLNDTLRAGGGLCDEETTQSILQQSQHSIEFLRNYGVNFDTSDNGQLSRAREAGHSERRIYHCGDQTGAYIISALLQHVTSKTNVTIFEHHAAINLITNDKIVRPRHSIEVAGVYALDTRSELIHTFTAHSVILATGGAGKVYRYTTNPDTATGDGIAMAHRAGARVGNLEFYQFHPTLFYNSKINNFLLSEALRGEGAYLRLPSTGERFMQRYAAEAMELATRDIVARAIFNEMEKSDFDFVYLDIRHKDKDFLQKRFPTIYTTLAKFGLDLSKDLIPVVPAAHYMCGGILADVHGTTDILRLYAIGETAFTGFHGANRLASNSLLEGVVMGRNAARASGQWLSQPSALHSPIKCWSSTRVMDARRSIQISAHWRGLRAEMSAYAGIIRTEAGLHDLKRLLALRSEIIEQYYWNHPITRDLIELRNIVLVAELIVKSALQRQESRGNHYREDYPNHAAQAEVSLSKVNRSLQELL